MLCMHAHAVKYTISQLFSQLQQSQSLLQSVLPVSCLPNQVKMLPILLSLTALLLPMGAAHLSGKWPYMAIAI